MLPDHIPKTLSSLSGVQCLRTARVVHPLLIGPSHRRLNQEEALGELICGLFFWGKFSEAMARGSWYPWC